MKIIHTSDIHLASALNAKLSQRKSAQRKRELKETFSRLCSFAEENGVEAIIIAGDLFDTRRVTVRDIDTTLSTIKSAAGVDFYYLTGNHEKDALLSCGAKLPENLHIFGSGWSYFEKGDVRFCGRSDTAPGMFSNLELKDGYTNIAVLHGEIRNHSDEGGIISLLELDTPSPDYIALGHYHSFSEHKTNGGAPAVYSGTPEGRGFDETGDMGFVLIDTEGGVSYRFIPFAKRRLLSVDANISDSASNYEIERKIAEVCAVATPDDLLRINLTGARRADLKIDEGYLTDRFWDKFFFFEIKNKTRLSLCADDYKYDTSLKGEFVRLCLAETELSEEDVDRIISFGFSALSGEPFEE